ncbi:NifB/NifX family molybdenum-iron cluster-binding protein [Methanohalophilus mahii]|uniref:Dinitrogenase iron-molybdenum cofactor biosynthesis protein n=1 Tax=Methanohalophilus mahii (strain ATCC 35705 / DSM 5219 / SLP) TaxID=547558 RepID=D5E9F9_METMS|nr:NifB/NifX family molybdenum-iron cluster-binding protein [Methanohalophilus mahii]ADE35810.1 Dinitrogenase iron-molybdenum cofactor biosynthesis protein [Methanohalophilus mahii DSM 5219]
MKICITSKNNTSDSEIETRFGRTPYFIIADTENGEFEAVGNPAAGATGGAGIQAAQEVAKMKADVLITGNVGPNAYEVLSTAGIEVVTTSGVSVKEAIEQYNNGTLGKVSGPTAKAHAGMGRGQGRGGKK